MPFHDISMVSILGLRGTLHVETAEDAEGVSVQAEGPYQAKVIDGTWLMIYPEGQEPPESQFTQRSHADMVLGRTHVGSVDVAAGSRFLTDSPPRTRARPRTGARPRTRTPRPRARARTSARLQATVHVTAPRGIQFELIGCHGMRNGPRGCHLMRGNDRFVTRKRR